MTGAPIDLLFRLTDRDQAFPHWGPNFGRIVSGLGGAGGSMSTTLTQWDASSRPPDGTILFITNLSLNADPGSAQVATQVRCEVRNRNTDEIMSRILDINAVPDVAFPDELVVQGKVDFSILIDRFYLKTLGGFSLGADTNRVTMNWAGYVVPRGEIGFS